MRSVCKLLLIMPLLLSCTKAPSIKAAKVARGSVEATVTTISSGTVEAEQQADLNFGSAGRIFAVTVLAGDKVKKGQPLASLENSDLRAIARDAQSEVKRVRDLFAAGLISKVGQDDAKRAAEIAQVNLDRSVITAPFAGLITEVNIRKGELAQSLTSASGSGVKPAIRIIDLKTRIVKGEIDELDLGKVHNGLEARVRIPALGEQKFAAKVERVVPFVSSTREQDRTSQIELRLRENDPRIPVGASAEVEIIVEHKEGALIVPARTVLGTNKQRYMYKVDGDHLKRTEVSVGVGNYERKEILKGLEVGDTVAFPSEEFDMSDGQKVKADIQPWP